MNITWDHYPETETTLEQYITVIDGITITIDVVPGDAVYWCTNQTGKSRGEGEEKYVKDAMAKSIEYVKKVSNGTSNQ